MNSLSTLTVIAGLCATGSSLLVLRRGPSRRLRLMVLTSGLLSLSQTATLLHVIGVWGAGQTYAVYLHQLLVAMLSLVSIYLLSTETRDRKVADLQVRLAEQALLPASSSRPASVELTTSADLRNLVRFLGPSNAPAKPQSKGTCVDCVDVAHEIGAAWEEIASALEAFEDAGKSDAGISRAKARLAAALRRRWQHELGCAHDVLAPNNALSDPKDENDEPIPEPTSLDAAILRTEP